VFNEYAARLHSEHAGIQISGENMSPGPLREGLAQVAQIGFYICLVGAFMNAEYRVHLIMGGFMLQAVAGQLLSTGAFEVFVNEKLVFSKIAEGRMLNYHEFSTLITRAL